MFCTNCGTSIADGSAFCPSCGAQLGGGTARPGPMAAPSAGPVLPAMDYATWGNRAIGYLIDHLIVGAVMGVLYVALGGFVSALAGLGSHDFGSGMCCLFIVLFPVATLLVGFYNRVYLISSRGYSIGQGVVKVKVVDAYGRLLTQGSAWIRLLAQAGMGLVPFLPVLDLLWPLWDERRQTLHDKAVGSYAINNPGA